MDNLDNKMMRECIRETIESLKSETNMKIIIDMFKTEFSKRDVELEHFNLENGGLSLICITGILVVYVLSMEKYYQRKASSERSGSLPIIPNRQTIFYGSPWEYAHPPPLNFSSSRDQGENPRGQLPLLSRPSEDTGKQYLPFGY